MYSSATAGTSSIRGIRGLWWKDPRAARAIAVTTGMARGSEGMDLFAGRYELVPVVLDRLGVRLRRDLAAEKQLALRHHELPHRRRRPVLPREQAVLGVQSHVLSHHLLEQRIVDGGIR